MRNGREGNCFHFLQLWFIDLQGIEMKFLGMLPTSHQAGMVAYDAKIHEVVVRVCSGVMEKYDIAGIVQGRSRVDSGVRYNSVAQNLYTCLVVVPR